MRATTIDALYNAGLIPHRLDAEVPHRYRQLDALDERTEKLMQGLPPSRATIARHSVGR